MDIKISPREAFPGRGPCVQMYGDYVTEEVWNVVKSLLCDNVMSSPVYLARNKANAFFQGGHHDSRGKWVLIEFWSEEEKCQDFLKILNEEVNKVMSEYSHVICIVAPSNNEKDIRNTEEACLLIADDTGCKFERNMLNARVVFMPEDNLTYTKVYQHVQKFGLRHLAWLDKWELAK